jgi:ferritin-like metal-binding protein YciE
LKIHKRFEDLFEEGIETLYDAETQIVDALPRMMAASSSKELAIAFAYHLVETRRHVTRLEDVFQLIGKEPRGRAGDAIRGLLLDVAALIDRMEASATLDIALVATARMVEHWEMVAYESAAATAGTLGQLSAADLLEKTLEEEGATDETLASIAASLLGGDAGAEDLDVAS